MDAMNDVVTGATVHLTGTGSCTVTASQQGDENYNPRPTSREPSRSSRAVQGAEGRRKRLAPARRAIAKSRCRLGKVGPPTGQAHGPRQLAKPPARAGAAGGLEDQPPRQSRSQALTREQDRPKRGFAGSSQVTTCSLTSSRL